jgi:GR25 family glycosyltransferase involved in LPS biosynthesis
MNMSTALDHPNNCIRDEDIPVLLTIFNRPAKVRAVIENLRQIKPNRLFVSADGPRPDYPRDIENCQLARQEATNVDWDCDIKTRFLDRNIGCDLAVPPAIDWFFQNEEYGIILEDDCLVHPHFFQFCGELLARYYDDRRIMQISSLSPYARREHPYDYHFSRIFRCSGGWATWRRAWNYFVGDMHRYSDKEALAILKAANYNYTLCYRLYRHYLASKSGREVQSPYTHWDYQWNLACAAQNGLAVVPEKNLMNNIGFDDDSTHTTGINPVFENLTVQPLRFPLRHPSFVFADNRPERSLEKKIFRSFSLKSRFMYLLRQAAGAVYYLDEVAPYGEGIDVVEKGSDIRITFGMIVFNGEPFIRYNLAAMYPVAHQLIVVEGACLSSRSLAGPNGHSTDGTLETLYKFKRESDPENKVIIVTAADEGYADGFWPEKDEMSRAYANRATGNYLWQLDSDEFYHEEQLSRVMELLRTKKPDMVSFPMITFWGSPDYKVDGFYLIRDRHDQIPRLFAWDSGYTYATHRPATVLDERGVDLGKKTCLGARDLKRMHIYMYHYALVFPHQVFSKVTYYKNRLNSCIDSWEESVFRRLEKPFRAHNVYDNIGWLERFKGDHPAAIRTMTEDIRRGNVKVEIRDCADVEKLLAKWRYRVSAALLRTIAYIMATGPVYFLYKSCSYLFRKVKTLVYSIRSLLTAPVRS